MHIENSYLCWSTIFEVGFPVKVDFRWFHARFHLLIWFYWFMLWLLTNIGMLYEILFIMDFGMRHVCRSHSNTQVFSLMWLSFKLLWEKSTTFLCWNHFHIHAHHHITLPSALFPKLGRVSYMNRYTSYIFWCVVKWQLKIQ